MSALGPWAGLLEPMLGSKSLQLPLETVQAERWPERLQEQRQRAESPPLPPPAGLALFLVWEVRLARSAEWTLPVPMQVWKRQ